MMTDVRDKPDTTSPISTRKHGDVLIILSRARIYWMSS